MGFWIKIIYSSLAFPHKAQMFYWHCQSFPWLFPLGTKGWNLCEKSESDGSDAAVCTPVGSNARTHARYILAKTRLRCATKGLVLIFKSCPSVICRSQLTRFRLLNFVYNKSAVATSGCQDVLTVGLAPGSQNPLQGPALRPSGKFPFSLRMWRRPSIWVALRSWGGRINAS